MANLHAATKERISQLTAKNKEKIEKSKSKEYQNSYNELLDNIELAYIVNIELVYKKNSFQPTIEARETLKKLQKIDDKELNANFDDMEFDELDAPESDEEKSKAQNKSVEPKKQITH